MAKNENKTENSEKRKAKKRKQQNVEEIHEEKVYLEQSKNASKRKSEPTNAISKKQKPNRDASNPNAVHHDDDELHEPTHRELAESEKPENLPDIQTVRQKKHKSHEKNLKGKQEHATLKESGRNENYLKCWKHSRSEWKFLKVRQISIQKSVLDATKMSDETFAIAVEYLSGSKGGARSAMEKLTEEEIRKLDAEFEAAPSMRKDKIKTSRYKRALELTRMLV